MMKSEGEGEYDCSSENSIDYSLRYGGEGGGQRASEGAVAKRKTRARVIVMWGNGGGEGPGPQNASCILFYLLFFTIVEDIL
jgi:hypothetical protein